MLAPPSSNKEVLEADPIVVRTFPKLAARIPAFLRNRRQDVVTMLDALAHVDFETVERLGHNMKGAGASFGFQAITDIGAAIERDAGRADTGSSRRWIGELSMYLDRVESDADSSVRLPLSDSSEALAEACAHDSPAAGCARRIVLVEDNSDLREGFRAVLEQSGHQVQEARDGIEGLALILADKPDVAIIDIGLHGMNGYDVARRVREALGQAVLLVAMTGFDRESDRLQAISAGFDLHMAKPVDIELVDKMLGPGPHWNRNLDPEIAPA